MTKITVLSDSAHGPGGSASVTGRALTPDELKEYAHAEKWVDVCKNWE